MERTFYKRITGCYYSSIEELKNDLCRCFAVPVDRAIVTNDLHFLMYGSEQNNVTITRTDNGYQFCIKH